MAIKLFHCRHGFERKNMGHTQERWTEMDPENSYSGQKRAWMNEDDTDSDDNEPKGKRRREESNGISDAVDEMFLCEPGSREEWRDETLL